MPSSSASATNTPMTRNFSENASAKTAGVPPPKPMSIFAFSVSHFANPRMPIIAASVATNACRRR